MNTQLTNAQLALVFVAVVLDCVWLTALLKRRLLVQGALLATLSLGLICWFSESLFGYPPLSKLAELGEAMGSIALIFSGLAAYAAFSTLQLEQDSRRENQLTTRLETCLAAKDRAAQAVRWRHTRDNAPPGRDLYSLPEIATALEAYFRDEPALDRKVGYGLGSPQFHPKWSLPAEGSMNEFYLGLGAYSLAIYEALLCISKMPRSISGIGCLTLSSRLNDSEMVILYYASSTLPGRWEKIGRLIESTRLLSYHPKAWEFLSPVPFDLRMKGTGLGLGAFMPPDIDE